MPAWSAIRGTGEEVPVHQKAVPSFKVGKHGRLNRVGAKRRT
jgi:hypothetical protein